MDNWSKRLKGKIIPGLIIVVVLLTCLVGLWERPELMVYDTWFNLRGVRPAPDDIVIVAMDDRSISKLGALPWPRRVHARLVDALKEARAIGFDVIFDTPGSPEDNAILSTAMKNHGNVVLAYMYTFQESNGQLYQTPVFPLQQLAAAAIGGGFINVPEDRDNVIRHITALDQNLKRPFPCFSLAVFLAAQGQSPGKLALEGQSTLRAGSLSLPLDSKGQMLIDYWGPAGTFKTYSYIDILEGKVGRDKLAGKIVLVGPTSAADQDFKSTPFTHGNMVLSGSLPTPGVEIHASAIGTYLSGSYYKRAAMPVNLAFILIMGVLSTLIFSRTASPWKSFLFLLGLMAAAAAAVYLTWNNGHYWINLVSPLGAAVFINIGINTENLVRTELERRRTQALFSRYVSPTVVKELLQSPEEIILGGTRRVLTVIFTDIRGFTSFSENKEPEYIVQRLNEYFTEMTAVIFKYGGTLDKYLGDGMMAFFGAPVHYEDHADRALAASLEMIRRLEDLNETWRAKGEPVMDIGVGINSGPVLVGNVGSPERMDYTIIGEDVNLASRLESMNKEYKTRIIISDRTVEHIKNREIVGLRPLGEANVRGMVVPVGIYTVDEKA